jgi:hypothetical protein
MTKRGKSMPFNPIISKMPSKRNNKFASQQKDVTTPTTSFSLFTSMPFSHDLYRYSDADVVHDVVNSVVAYVLDSGVSGVSGISAVAVSTCEQDLSGKKTRRLAACQKAPTEIWEPTQASSTQARQASARGATGATRTTVPTELASKTPSRTRERMYQKHSKEECLCLYHSG